MRPRILLPLLLLVASSARVSAQEPVRAGPGLTLTAADFAPTAGPSLRLGLGPAPVAFLATVGPAGPSGSRLSGLDGSAAPGTPRLHELRGWRPIEGPGGPVPRIGLVGTEPGIDSAVAVAGDTVERSGVFREIELPGVVQEVADLSLRVEGRGELGGAWQRFRPCDPQFDFNCSPDLLPRLQPDVQFGVQVGGTLTDRIHVDVDYDQRREFDAANNISIYYQGGPGEVLQRVEMGDVSIELPASRYLTQGIPAGNFGFKTAAQMGPLDVEAVWAQQKGDIATREFRLGGAGQEGLVQDQELVLDDADYVAGQFFFLVDPTQLDGWPHIDVMTLDRFDAPASIRPRADRLALYRDEGVTMRRYAEQAQAGTFLADAVTAGNELTHSGLFGLLEPGDDYYIHPSGLWVALRAPLRRDEGLAVAYETETGAQVGDPAAEATPPGVTPTLRLIRGPVTIHQPGQPTWDWEMHQIYRLDSSAQVETSTLELSVSLGHAAAGGTFKDHAGQPISLLRLFGLDSDAPADRLDLARLFRPGAEEDIFESSALRGTFVVFPTLEPFGTPPPVPSEGLSALETAAILGPDANPAIYDEPDPVVRSSSSRFRLNFRYQVRLEGLLSSFNLGAFGIRPGSERVTVDDQLLTRGRDYVIDYDLGLVTLLDPEATLGRNPDAEIRTSWEQKSLFEIAPTTVFGLNAATRLGAYGDLNFIGMYQSQQSVVRRPQLGSAPGAVLLGGASGRLAFQANWLSRALDAIPMLTVDSVTRLDIAGEVAVSAAEPNRAGHTYLDDFEATDELPLSLDAAEWQLGSMPQDGTAFPLNTLPLTVDNAADLVWQDRYRIGDRELGFLTPQEIDEQIVFAGAQIAEPVLYMTLGGGDASAPQWRSLTTVLSTTGQDLSRSEFLEFYAAPFEGPTGGATLVIDIGAVSEDAFFVDSTGSLEGLNRFGEAWGRDVLDSEARLALRQVWGPDNDRRGIWGQTCTAERVAALPLGDPRANCTVLNGRPDSEDLNANGVLDAQDGPSFRYVIPIGSSSPYLVRGQAATNTPFRLFRIPLRGPNAIPLNGATEATWGFVKHMRVTVIKPTAGEGTVAMARLRITGSRWTKRGLTGVLAGLTSDDPGSGSVSADIRVGPVSKLTDGDGYDSPPGVENELQDPASAIGPAGVEFNEKSLRMEWQSLPFGERAEVYFRYPQQPRNFLDYRQLRFWAVPRRGMWGPNGDHELLFKVGTDSRNYYVYRSELKRVPVLGAIDPDHWLPEHVVEVQEWLSLRAEAERRLVEDGSTRPIEVWSDDGRYGIVLEDRARAPNLAAVRELTLAVYNRGGAETDGEVWIDDIRLGGGSTDPGFAGRMDLDLNAGGVFRASVAMGARGGRFRQLEDSPSYETVQDLNIVTTTELGRVAPQEWGISMPVTVSYLRTDLEPFFLQGTDVRADRLRGLRETGTSRRRVGVTLRKVTPSSNPVLSALVDGTVLRAGHIHSSDATVTTASRLDGFEGGIEVDRGVTEVAFGIVPGFVETLLRWLAPRRVERSPFFDRLTDARLRVTPERVGLSANYLSQRASVWRYDQVLESLADLDVVPTRSPRQTLESGARLSFRPLESLTARVGVTSDRDVLDPARATSLADERQALQRARDHVGGVPIGWERRRVLTTDAAFRPAIAEWLRPSVTWSTRFVQRRDPSHIGLRTLGDSAAPRLQRTFDGDRQVTRGVLFDLAAALRAAIQPDAIIPADEPSDSASGERVHGLLAITAPLKPFELTWTDQAGSRFDRDLAAPGVDYQLGLVGSNGLMSIGGDTAALTLRRNGFRARSGLRLGPTTSLDVGYSESLGRVTDLRAGPRSQLERAWPDLQFGWQDAPVPSFARSVLDRWSFSTGFVRTERVTRLGRDVIRVRSQHESTIPLEFRLGFASGLSMAYTGSFTLGDGEDPTGLTRRTAMTHAVSLNGRFDAPAPLRAALPQPVRISASYDYQEQLQSRVITSLVDTTDPTPFIDHINRRLNLTLSSILARTDVGIQASYVDRQSFIGTQAGSSQFQLSLFGQFSVEAGTGQ